MSHEHRLVDGCGFKVFPFGPPFSSFEYVDQNYGAGYPAIRRIFSLARSLSAHTLMIEDIDPKGIILDENDEIEGYCPGYHMGELQRISFWRSRFGDSQAARGKKGCVGYAILKHDVCPPAGFDQWHIFEAVFEKYPHKHNCVPNPMAYEVTLGQEKHRIRGLLYAQQNALNKTCAQVALRSLISRVIGRDVSYREINDFARTKSSGTFKPSNGLGVPQIQAVLDGFKIRFRDFDYNIPAERYRSKERKRHPYQKYVYAGVECGIGALVGFRMLNDQRHIIPFYGHTFNKDTWAPDADRAYFRVTDRLGYIPSEYWTSSFLGHDDNFGPNFCVPRLYVQPAQVEYVVELLKPGIQFGGAQAEALAIQVLDAVCSRMGSSQNKWLDRLAGYTDPKDGSIVLRAISMDKERYARHLSSERDWLNNSEDSQLVDILKQLMPEKLWVVEVSIPQLFPANERKLGEIVLNGGLRISSGKKNHSHFVFARLPGRYFFPDPGPSARNGFVQWGSRLLSHTPVIRFR